MTWKFYSCIVVALLAVAAIVCVKAAARARAKKAYDDLISAMAKAKREEEDAKRPPQSPKNPWDLTEEDLKRRIRGR
jgi:hypothetical protein